MKNKLRKTLGSPDAPYIQSLMRLMAAQSKETIGRWCLDYAQSRILPVFERRCPGDARPRRAIGRSGLVFGQGETAGGEGRHPKRMPRRRSGAGS